MAWSIDLGTPCYQQVDTASCGGAVAQMILTSIGARAKIGGGPIDQGTLFTLCDFRSTGDMHTGPDGLEFTLNAFRPRWSPSGFSIGCVDNVHDASASILRTLCHFPVATGTLVFGCGHWVVVRGARTNVDPVSDDGALSIEGFYINNPWPPPNLDGGVLGGSILRGFSNEYVDYAEWKNTYLTGCSNGFISVSDSRCPPPRPIEPADQVSESAGTRRISPDDALAMANRGIKQHVESGPLSTALGGAQAVSPQLVKRLDRPNKFYYLILMRRDDGAAAAVVRVDASNGALLGIGSLEGITHVPIIAPDAAVAKAREAVTGSADGSGRIVLPDKPFIRQETLVWCPCEQSCSPYYPFHQIAHADDTIYVGYDGMVYRTLDDPGRRR